MRENEVLKQEQSYNRTLLAQTRMKNDEYINTDGSGNLNSSGDINLGDSRLDTGLNNNEIENVVML